MLKKNFLLFLIASIALSACGTLKVSMDSTPTPAVDANLVATIVAATLAAYPSATSVPALTVTPTPEVPTVLPHALYYLGSFDSETGIGQIDRLARDGITSTQITSESGGITQFDVSPADGQLVYNSGNQLVLTDANGGNRRVLAENSVSPYLASPYWSPDGQTIAYRLNGINLYSIETGEAVMILADEGKHEYTPGGFSPDSSKLITFQKGPANLAVYDIASKKLFTPDPSSSFGNLNHVSWLSDSKSIVIFDSFAGGISYGISIPGLWRYNVETGIGGALLDRSEDGSIGKYCVEAPIQDSAGNLLYLYGTSETICESPPFSLVRSDADGATNRVTLRPEAFQVRDAIWTLDGNGVVIFQNTESGRPLNLVLVPVDPSRPVVTLVADANTLSGILRWGP